LFSSTIFRTSTLSKIKCNIRICIKGNLALEEYPNPRRSKIYIQQTINNLQWVSLKCLHRYLLESIKRLNLKEGLIEHYDFEAVSSQVWRHLFSWYQTDWSIARMMKKDKSTKKKLILNLYPGMYFPHLYVSRTKWPFFYIEFKLQRWFFI
jgi:hypothetical protein